MILGISGSGRKNRMVHQTVLAIATESGQEYEVISLAGKKINGCIGCTQCAADNICKVKDDWNEIGEKMAQANVIIFGAPNYYGTINALGHVTVESYDQCYTCGFGHDCKSGKVVPKHGVLASIEKEHLPLDFKEQSSTQRQVSDIVIKLESRLQE